jgi:hypothetical protein
MERRSSWVCHGFRGDGRLAPDYVYGDDGKRDPGSSGWQTMERKKKRGISWGVVGRYEKPRGPDP